LPHAKVDISNKSLDPMYQSNTWNIWSQQCTIINQLNQHIYMVLEIKVLTRNTTTYISRSLPQVIHITSNRTNGIQIKQNHTISSCLRTIKT